MTVQKDGQFDRPAGTAGASPWLLGAAIGGSIAVHGLAAAVAWLALTGPRLAVEEDAAIPVTIESRSLPAATADEATAEMMAAALPAPPAEDTPPPSVPAVDYALPLPSEVPPPDFTPPPAQTVEHAPPPAPDMLPPDIKPPQPPAPAAKAAAPKPQEAKRPADSTSRQEATGAAAPPSAPLPAASTAATAPSAPLPAVASSWNALMAAWLAKHNRYPEDARRRGEHGQVTVRFVVAPDGRVSEVTVVRGSGYAALDTATLNVLRGAKVPAPGVQTTGTFKLRFDLND